MMNMMMMMIFRMTMLVTKVMICGLKYRFCKNLKFHIKDDILQVL